MKIHKQVNCNQIISEKGGDIKSNKELIVKEIILCNNSKSILTNNTHHYKNW